MLRQARHVSGSEVFPPPLPLLLLLTNFDLSWLLSPGSFPWDRFSAPFLPHSPFPNTLGWRQTMRARASLRTNRKTGFKAVVCVCASAVSTCFSNCQQLMKISATLTCGLSGLVRCPLSPRTTVWSAITRLLLRGFPHIFPGFKILEWARGIVSRYSRPRKLCRVQEFFWRKSWGGAKVLLHTYSCFFGPVFLATNLPSGGKRVSWDGSISSSSSLALRSFSLILGFTPRAESFAL